MMSDNKNFMNAEDFREKAKKGGWKETPGAWETSQEAEDALMLLDPKAWRAVGKIERWKKMVDSDLFFSPAKKERVIVDGYKHRMHEMIDALDDGKTPEEFLKTL